MITPEEVYNLYHKETNAARGRNVRQVKNFKNAKSKPTWKHFEYCANVINRNNGHIDPKLYMKSLAQYFEGWFDPKHLGHPKSMKIYKEHIKELEDNSSEEFIRESILNSIKFVSKYCKKKGIKELYDYTSEDMYLIPTVLKHLHAGSISMYFLAAIPNILSIVNSYPPDCQADYIPDFLIDYPKYRIRISSRPKLKEISDKLEVIIEKLVQN